MPSAEQIKQFLSLTILPVAAGVLANWLIVHLHFLASFHIGVGSVTGVLSQLGVFGITTLIAFLTSHHILAGSYTPAARAAAGRR